MSSSKVDRVTSDYKTKMITGPFYKSSNTFHQRICFVFCSNFRDGCMSQHPPGHVGLAPYLLVYKASEEITSTTTRLRLQERRQSMQTTSFNRNLFFSLQPIWHSAGPHACHTTDTSASDCNKKAVLPQGNRAMPQVFFSVEVRQQHSLQV